MSGGLELDDLLRRGDGELGEQRAFELFTARIGEWWPLATHSVGEDQATGVVFGEGIGGSIVESLADGTTYVWGTITRWDPPHSVAYTWHAGTPVTEATSVEVTFTPGEQGHTVVQAARRQFWLGTARARAMVKAQSRVLACGTALDPDAP